MASAIPASDYETRNAHEPPIASTATPSAQQTVYRIIFAVACAHFINDVVQATLPAVYPMLKAQYALSFTQIGTITFVSQITASLLQPAVGIFTDKRPQPYLLPIGMLSTLTGVVMLSLVTHFPLMCVAAALIGVGSSTFHPEASRVARMASGGRFGFAQSSFQFGGNMGTSLAPILAALIIIPFGQARIAVAVLPVLVGIAILSWVSRWYRDNLSAFKARSTQIATHGLSNATRNGALFILAALVFSKNVYSASLTNYFTFYLMENFHIGVRHAQTYLFLFLGAVAIGTFVGGPIGDVVGRKKLIWFSIFGAVPFTLALPYANLFWTGVLAVIIGLIIASAFSAIVVFAQELMPENVGMVAGIFFGLAFGFAGISAGLLGIVADAKGLVFVYKLCSFLPLIGILAALLPDLPGSRTKKKAATS